MKKMIFLSSLFLFFILFGSVFAQTDEVVVSILEMSATIENTQADGTGSWYYDIKGEIERDGDENIYLMLRDESGIGKPIMLVEYIGRSPRNIRFPNCDDTGSLNCLEVEVSNAPLVPGHTYELYFSSNSDGSIVSSDIYLLEPIPDRENETGDDTDTTEQDEQGGSTSSSGNSGSGGGISLNPTQTDIVNNGLVPTNCGYDLKTVANPDGTGRLCGFADAIRLIQRIIEYIFVLILPIAALVFAYAGFLYLTSGGNIEKRNAAKRAIKNVIIGIVIVMMAWLAVKTLLVSLGVDESFLIYLDI